MKAVTTKDVTQLLRAWGRGDADARDQLYRLVYDELHRLAHQYMYRENPGHTLQTTALVNEAYLRLGNADGMEWKDRTHFFAVSAKIMRHVLIDEARARQAACNGGGLRQVSLDDILEIPQSLTHDWLALDEALTRLTQEDERKGQVVELRFFGGLSVEETADVLGVSPDTILRDWRFAKAWLKNELSKENSHEVRSSDHTG